MVATITAAATSLSVAEEQYWLELDWMQQPVEGAERRGVAATSNAAN